jgi:hypothetical protein
MTQALTHPEYASRAGPGPRRIFRTELHPKDRVLHHRRNWLRVGRCLGGQGAAFLHQAGSDTLSLLGGCWAAIGVNLLPTILGREQGGKGGLGTDMGEIVFAGHCSGALHEVTVRCIPSRDSTEIHGRFLGTERFFLRECRPVDI